MDAVAEYLELPEEQIQTLEKHLLRRRAIVRARNSFRDYVLAMHPSIEALDDWSISSYELQAFHDRMISALQDVIDGKLRRLILACPPRHGKSTLVSKMLPSYLIGKYPDRSNIFATYGDEFSWDFGRNVREILESIRFQQVFPGVSLRKGGRAQDRLETTLGGLSVFLGKGGPLTGRGAHVLILDDLVKDYEDARSPARREADWNWLTKVAMTRLMDHTCAVVLIMTRWSHDDPIGRLTDPDNPYYNEEEAAEWKVIEMPALARAEDEMGRAPGEALWPDRFPVDFLRAQQRMDPLGFEALYQQRPTLESGIYFQEDWFEWYRPGAAPNVNGLRVFGASDHALGQDKKRHDQTVLLIAGVDQNDDIWLLDCFWQRVNAEQQVDQMIRLMKKWPVIRWFTEKSLITKSLGPFLYRRMREEHAATTMEGVASIANKEVRARSIQGFMARGQVKFPNLPWAELAKAQMLRFTGQGDPEDDFVDAIAYLGLKLQDLMGKNPKSVPKAHARWTHGWLREQEKYEARQRQSLSTRSAW